MATKIRDIIDYYTGHEVSNDIKERVLERIAGSMNSEEANDAYRDLWDKADSAYMSDEEVSAAYNRIFSQDDENEKANVKTLQIFTWARVAAVVVPLLLLVVFGKLYVDMSNQLKESQMISMLQEHTISDESKVISLADGTKIRLSRVPCCSILPHSKVLRSARCSCRVRLSSTSSMMTSNRSMSVHLILRLPTWVPPLRFLLIPMRMRFPPR